MRTYPINSPEAMARVLVLFMVTDDNLGETSLDSLEKLHVYLLLGLPRKKFIEVLTTFCEELSDEESDDGAISLLDVVRVNEIIESVVDRQKRLLLCAIILDFCKAAQNKDMSQSGLTLLRHTMKQWRISLDDIQTELIKKTAG